MILTTLAISLATLTDIFYVYKFYLPLWVTLISASIATQKHIVPLREPIITKKNIYIHIAIILIALLSSFIHSAV